METGGDEGLIERVVDSKDLQQQSKAFDKLTDRVEDRQLDSTRVQEVLSLFAFLTLIELCLCLCFGFLWLWLMTWQAMASIATSSEADWNAMKLRYIQTIRIDFQNSLYVDNMNRIIYIDN